MAKGISVPVTQSGLESSINQAVKNVGPINIPATIDPSAFKNLAQPLGRVSGLATEFEKSIAASNARVLAFGASVGIINGVQNAFSELVRTGIDVQKTLADIAAISGKGGQELSKFGDALFDVAKNTSQSFKTASQAALEFSRQGLTTEETLKRTSDALTLTRFTSLNAAEAVDVLTAAANSFSESGITTAQIINKLIAVDTKFAVSAEDLANGLARAGSIAQEVGVNFDQLNAAITIAQERTARGGAVIGNALKTIFTRIRSDETVKALQEIGIFSRDAEGGLKPVVNILTELATKLNTLGETKKIQVLEAVASKYNINILSALISDLNDANGKFSEVVGISAGASNQAYERQIELNKTLAAQINGVAVSVGQLFNKLAEIGITDNLNSLLKFVNDLLSGFNKLLDSEGIGGNVAKGIIKGLSDVFFTIGLPIIGAIFIKLTKDIAQFGVESLKTILGINQQVRERQALEQAVVNTLVRDQEIMATILALSGNRAKQEEYLLGVYNKQLAALQQVQNIAATVAPALMAGGLSATSGQIRRRGAGGYLPAQEAADVRRGVGGASPSSKVVSIPNFAFGGGKRGTMIANTSEYIVPNFANGGSAIFNQDMAKAYGLPSGAKKISASGGYVPNFARYVYDADRIEPDKNALLKAILASNTKKNLIVGPAGAGKSTYGASLGSFITNVSQLADATEIDILSGAARSKDGGLSKNFQQIASAVNSSGGKISYLYAGNMDLYSRRVGRMGSGPMEGDLRSAKQISGSLYAPMNQFDFISKVKNSARNFEMIRGAGGYIPNFADQQPTTYYTAKPEYASQLAIAGLPSSFSSKKRGTTKADVNAFLNSKGLRLSDVFSSETISGGRSEASSNYKIATATAAMLLPNSVEAAKANALGREGVVPSKENLRKANLVKFEAFGLTTSSASGQKDVPDIAGGIKKAILKEAFRIVSSFDPISGKVPFSEPEFEKFFFSKGGAPGAVAAAAGAAFESAVDYAFNPAEADIGSKGGITLDVKRISPKLREVFGGIPNKFQSADYKIGHGQYKKFANQILANDLYTTASKGYIPNFAKGGPLEDAIQREMAAGLNPSQIRITKDGRLRNSQNPNGLAVINTRDEPNGKIPNFSKNEDRIRKELFGSGIAQGPLLPKNWSPPTESNSQANSTANEGKASKSADSAIGKLLLMQGAVVGVTGALQTLTEEGSTASMALEGAGGVISTAVSAFSGKTAGFGPLGIAVSALGTAFATLGPVVTKYIASLETEQERVIKALAGLADQAEKTGEAVTPEAFLAAFEKAQKQSKGKTERESGIKAIEGSLSKMGVEGSDEVIKSIFAGMSAAGMKINEENLKNVVQTGTQTRYGGGGMGPTRGYNVEVINEERTLENLKLKVLDEKVKKETGIAAAKKDAEIAASELAKKTIDFENTQIRNKLNIQQKIFDAEQNITNEYFKRNLSVEKNLTLLDQQKSLMTEAAYLEQKYALETAKINSTSAKERQEAAKNLKKEFSGLGGGLGSILGNVDVSKIGGIVDKLSLDKFKEDQGKAAIDEIKSIAEESESNIDTSGISSLSNLSQEQREIILKAVQDYSNALKTSSANSAQALISLGQQFELTLTSTQKLAIEINSLSKILNNSGAYEDKVNEYKLGLIKSLGELAVKNKLELDSASELIASKIETARANLNHARAMREATGIENRAEEDAINLQNETENRVDVLKREAINSDLRIKTERDLLNAETDKLEAENKAYKNLNMSDIVNEQLRNARAKLVESERKAEEQNQVAIQMARANFNADVAAVDRKIALAQAYNKEIQQADINLKVERDLQLEGQNLLTARRQAIAQFNKIDLGVQNFSQGFGTTQINDITKILTEGRGYADMGIGAGTLEAQAKANVAAQRRRGRGLEGEGAISMAELYNINTGRGNTISQNASIAGAGLLDQAQTFQSIIGTQAPKMFADKMAEAMQATLNSADNLGEALSGIATSFLSEMQRAFLQSASSNIVGMMMPKMAKGGLITGGSGYKDDVPAMLMGGEFVMRKSAVQKYGVENLKKMNNGGIFIPGVRGGGAISGEDALRAFATQTTTSGATDILKGGTSSAYANLEDQSARLSRFALLGDDAINQEIRGTQQQALEAISRKDQYLQQQKEQKKQLKKQLIGTIASAALSYGVSRIGVPKGNVKIGPLNTVGFLGGAYGGMIRRYASGGPVDDIPALLMSGEYVMNRQSTSKYGRRLLDSMNQGRLTRFADGGEVGGETTTTTESNAKMMGDVSININVSGGASQTEAQGNTNQGGIDYKKMSERIKAVVIETINEEKRLGGSLRTR